MPAWYLEFLFTSVIVILSYLTVGYLLKRAHVKPSHKGLVIAAIAILGILFLSWILDAFDINLFEGRALNVFQSVLTLLFLGMAAYMISIKIRSGSELADLGPSPLHLVFLGLGVITFAVGAHILVTRSLPIGNGIVNLAEGTFMVVMGLARSQLRDRGLYHFGNLVPWDKIAGYEWSEKGVLLVDLKQRKWWQDRLQVPVPTLLVQQVDELMRERVAA